MAVRKRPMVTENWRMVSPCRYDATVLMSNS
jgi:hypothetical protein